MIRETLWKLASEILAIEALIEARDGEFVDDKGNFAPELEAEFDRLGADFEEKMRQCREYRMTLEHNAEFHAVEAKRLAAVARRMTTSVVALENYMANQIIRLKANEWAKESTKSVKYALSDQSVTWTVLKTRGRTVVDDLDLIPESCLVPQPSKPDLEKIRELIERKHLMGGAHIVPGISLREK